MLRALLPLLLLAACGPDFRGERNVGFSSSLKRQFVPWTPAQPIALGTPVQFNVVPESCLFGCPPPIYFNAHVDAGALRQTASSPEGSGRLVALAEEEGSSVVRVVSLDGGVTDRFTVRVKPAADLALTDPVLFNRRAYPDFIGFDGGDWPDVGNSIVMGPGGKLYLEVLVLDDAGMSMGISGALLDAGNADSAWSVKPAGMQVDLHSPASGATTFDVGYGDAGVTRRFDVRVATPVEASFLALLVSPISAQRFVIKADVRTLDGGPFMEPELQWLPDPGFVELDTQAAFNLRPRRDVKVYDFTAPDAGTYDAGVEVRIGSFTSRVQLSPQVVEGTPPPMGTPPPNPEGCGCTSSPAPLLLAVAALVGTRRRRRGSIRPA